VSVRGSRKARPDTDTRFGQLVGELKAGAERAGLDALGIAAAEPFADTARTLTERKAAGLHGGMHFTYGNPARSTTPERALEGARAIVVGARRYRRQARGVRPRNAGRVAAYSWHDHYAELRAALAEVTRPLAAAGWKTRVLADDNALVDRAAARRAGLGSFGRNANLLLPGRGSFFVLGAVLTDAPVGSPDAGSAEAQPSPLAAPVCRSCTRCVDACPTGAIVGPGVVDARRCLAWLVQQEGPFPRQHRADLADRLYGCDDCQEVCPPNRRAAPGRPAAGPASAGPGSWIDVAWVLDASDDELLDRLGRWYVPRRDPRYLRRNALVVLGNTGDPRDPGTERLLRAALTSPDPLLRAHAAWAAAALGRTDLLALVEGDDDPEVQEELLAAGAARGPR
jgi:epoxyqueuosine reductase